jgi:hypothetical protein
MKSKTDVHATNLNEVIVLDSGSTIKATFKTKSMVGNVQTAVKPLVMNMNGGTLVVKKTGVILHLGQLSMVQSPHDGKYFGPIPHD